MPTKLGVVGLSKNGGWAASNLIPPVLAKPLSDSFALTALSTTSETSAEATAAHYTELTQSEVKPYHGETTAIAADSNVDLVVVSVHVQYHKDAALPVIAAGKDVFVEWPLGKNLEEAKIMTLAAQERGVRHAVGLQSWNVPAFAKVKELLQANKIGRIVSSSWYSAKSPTVGANAPRVATYALKYRNPAMGGTYLDIPIAHNLSAITHALGNLRYVNSTFAVGFPEVKVADSEDAPNPRYIRNHHNLPDQWSISGVFESGALFSGTWISLGKNLPSGQPSMVWEVVGTDGVIRVESRNAYTGFAPALALPEVLLVNGESVDLTEANAAMSAVGWAWDAWARGDKAKIPTFEDALDLHRLIEAIKQSHKQGHRVYVSETA